MLNHPACRIAHILAPPSNAKEPVENPDADAPSNVQAPVGKRLLTRLSTDKSCRIRTEYPQNNEAPGKPLPRKRANPTQNRIHLPMRKREPINPTLEAGSLTSQIVVTTHPNHGAQTNPLPMTQIPAPNDDPVFILRPSISRMDGFFLPHPIFPIRPTENNGEGQNLQGSFQNRMLLFHHRTGKSAHSPRIKQLILKG